MGSLGAAFGAFILGITIAAYGYKWGFNFVISMVILVAVLPLSKILVFEVKQIREIRKAISNET